MGRRPPKILELFSPPRLSLRALEAGLETTKPSNLDLTSGWDALQWRDRKKMWQILEEQKPDVVIMSPDCRMFSQLMNVNLERIPIERLTRDQMQALVMWQLCLQVADYQLQRGRSFVLEQPGGASSWQTHGAQWLSKQDQVHHFLFDQCELGLRVTPTGLSRKTTGLMTNHLGVAFLLSQYQCTKSHGHVPLESGLPSWTASLEAHQSLLDDVLADEDDDEDMGERQPRTPGTLHRDSSESLTVEQKKKIELLHCNMGHLSRDQMLLMLRAANAKEGVLKYTKQRKTWAGKKLMLTLMIKIPPQLPSTGHITSGKEPSSCATSKEKIRLATRQRIHKQRNWAVGELQELTKQGRSSKAGAVDVSSEGPPPEDVELHPVPSSEIDRPLSMPNRSQDKSANSAEAGTAEENSMIAWKEELLAEMSKEALNFLEFKVENECLMVKPIKTKNQEFNMKEATCEERRGFEAADQAEWKTILDLKAVKVLSPDDSKKVRRQCPHRILQSRFVRRKKPVPGLGQWKFKSRWCVLGHSDPDSGTYSTYSPMPMTESISIFFQLCTNMDLTVTFCDVTQAFCQSEPLVRPQGELYVEACEGLGLPAGTLIQLVAPVYGLEDAPLRWRQTVISYLTELGFERSLLEPCWYVRRDDKGSNEVDTVQGAWVIMAADRLPSASQKIKADITRSNGALEDLLRTSKLVLWDEKEELKLRKDDPMARYSKSDQSIDELLLPGYEKDQVEVSPLFLLERDVLRALCLGSEPKQLLTLPALPALPAAEAGRKHGFFSEEEDGPRMPKLPFASRLADSEAMPGAMARLGIFPSFSMPEASPGDGAPLKASPRSLLEQIAFDIEDVSKCYADGKEGEGSPQIEEASDLGPIIESSNNFCGGGCLVIKPIAGLDPGDLNPYDAEWLKAKREEDEEDIEQGLRIPNFMPNNFCLFGFILQCLVLSIQGKLTDVDS
ncbi:unnamed protein product [Durusdinium trenchii]|uniref:Reverse transcriptase Ty1/copia-type domain-containing protein n=1 Tax=Durusdinium trenchii TaxID=1381693 RepID=A0ABP0R3J1_9DINO